MSTNRVAIFFASPLEAELIERVRAVSPRLELFVAPDLWPKLRYVADHTGEPPVRTPEGEARWLAMLARAEVCFDFDRSHLADTVRLAPRLRWIQSTSAGIIHYMEASGVDKAGITVTTASGVHAVPLAEWVTFAVLWHEKMGPLIARLKADRQWERFCGGEALGRTACVVGYGRVGSEVGRHLEAIGVRVYGVDSLGLVRKPTASIPADESVTAVRSTRPVPKDLDIEAVDQALGQILPLSDYLVIATPGTEDTVRLIDRRRLELMPPSGFVVNIGRGSVIEEQALIEMLASGRLAGAALDVFEREPLPADSPLWAMPNVLINPHSASTSWKENSRITDIFCYNLRRYLAGEPLVNVYDPLRGY
ncbi:MAG: D-2-hydroxyacid dehydrogenase [Bacillota bacterium]|nr:D-2-hydroxyacid dehydrogenase [Bacillota bacterium]